MQESGYLEFCQYESLEAIVLVHIVHGRQFALVMYIDVGVSYNSVIYEMSFSQTM